MKYLVVGLGNIGAEYADTRHNIGFKVLDCLAEQSNIAFTTGRYGATAELRYKGRTLVLLKPSTYMNLSGKAVRYWMEAEKIAPENLLVVVDDIALPFGTLRMRPKGSAGGHNGLKTSPSCWARRRTPASVSASAAISPAGIRWTTCWGRGRTKSARRCPSG